MHSSSLHVMCGWLDEAAKVWPAWVAYDQLNLHDTNRDASMYIETHAHVADLSEDVYIKRTASIHPHVTHQCQT